MHIDAAISAFTTLFVVVDPLGLIPVFLVVTAGMDRRMRRNVACAAAAIAFVLLVFFALFGAGLLALLGITLPAFRIAGGLLLFYTAFEMVFGERRARQQHERPTAQPPQRILEIAAFPLAIPLMAGPGAITAVILLAGTPEFAGPGLVVLLAIALAVCLCALACFVAALPIDRLLGATGRTVLTRLLGVLLAALAVQFVADGIRDVFALAA